jgi:hypothetical protein
LTKTSARRSSNLLQGWHGFNRAAATTLLILSLYGVILGSSARAQNPRDPSVLVPTAPDARDAAVDPNAKVSRCARDRDRREEIDRAIRDHFATLYQNYCRGFESDRIFDIQMEEIRIQGDSAIVSYVLVLFETCEEGAPLSEASRHKEHWIRKTNGWEPEEIAPRLAP